MPWLHRSCGVLHRQIYGLLELSHTCLLELSHTCYCQILSHFILLEETSSCGVYTFYSTTREHISDEAKDFVDKLIEVDPNKRMNAVEALNHKWLSKEFNISERSPNATLMETVHENIINYGAVSEFKKLALMVIAHNSTTDEIIELRKAFDAFDTGNNGTISFDEFKIAMKNSSNHISDEEVERLFHTLDVGVDNEIYYLEFLAATLEAHGRITEERWLKLLIE